MTWVLLVLVNNSDDLIYDFFMMDIFQNGEMLQQKYNLKNSN